MLHAGPTRNRYCPLPASGACLFFLSQPLRTDASAALKKAAEQQQQGSAVASSDPHAPSSGSNPAMVANARGSGAGEDDARAGYDATA